MSRSLLRQSVSILAMGTLLITSGIALTGCGLTPGEDSAEKAISKAIEEAILDESSIDYGDISEVHESDAKGLGISFANSLTWNYHWTNQNRQHIRHVLSYEMVDQDHATAQVEFTLAATLRLRDKTDRADIKDYYEDVTMTAQAEIDVVRKPSGKWWVPVLPAMVFSTGDGAPSVEKVDSNYYSPDTIAPGQQIDIKADIKPGTGSSATNADILAAAKTRPGMWKERLLLSSWPTDSTVYSGYMYCKPDAEPATYCASITAIDLTTADDDPSTPLELTMVTFPLTVENPS